MIDKIGVRYEKVVNGVYQTGIMYLTKEEYEKLLEKEKKQNERSGIQKK